MGAPHVFVSHATSDAAFANSFSQDLRQLGADVWLDSSHLGAGDFVARINDALQRSDVFVLVLTPAALASQWVQQEMNAAITREKQGMLRALFVVMAQHCPLGAIPPLWTVYNRYDANTNYTGALYGVAAKMGLRVPSAAARTALAPSTPMLVTPIQAQVSSSASRPQYSAPYSKPAPLTRTPLIGLASAAPTPARRGRRWPPAHPLIFGATTLSLVLTVIWFSVGFIRALHGKSGVPQPFFNSIVWPRVLVTTIACVSTLSLTVWMRAKGWVVAVLGSIVVEAITETIIDELLYAYANASIALLPLFGLFIMPYLLLLWIGLVGLGPRRTGR